MAKMVKCDRCGRVDDGNMIVSCGISEFFVGSKIERYVYSDEPRFEPVDLCRECHGEYNALTQKFMQKERAK